MVLNEFKTQQITWDKATKQFHEKIEANSGDTNGRKLKVQIINNSLIEDLTGVTLNLAWRTKDNSNFGLDVFKVIDATKGIFEILYTTEMLSNVKKLKASLVMIDSIGRTESNEFDIDVKPSVVNDGAVQSQNSFTTLTEALVKINDLEGNYAPRLNEVTAQLAQKADKLKVRQDTASKPINVSEMDTETKTLFTGGSVAVVGLNAVGGENLKPKSVTQDKLDDLLAEKIKQNTPLYDLLENRDRVAVWNENGGIANYNKIFIPANMTGQSTFFEFFKKIDSSLIGATIRLHFKLYVDNLEMVASDMSKLSCVIGTKNNGMTSNPITDIGIKNKVIKVNDNFITCYLEYTVKAGDTDFYSAVQIRNVLPLTNSATITAQELYYDVIEMPAFEIGTNATNHFKEMNRKLNNGKLYMDMVKNYDAYKKYQSLGGIVERNVITIPSNTGFLSASKYIKKVSEKQIGVTFKFTARVELSNDVFAVANFREKFNVHLDILRNDVTKENETVSNANYLKIDNTSYTIGFEYTVKNGDQELQPTLRINNSTSVSQETKVTLSELYIEVSEPNGIQTTQTIFMNELASKVVKKGRVSQVVVAAHNSIEEDKRIADYVCDGINDEVELNKALSVFEIKSGKVLLCNGDYYIDSLWDSEYEKYGRYALPIKGPGNTREVIIEGMNAPLRDRYKTSLDLTISPVLRLRKELYDSLSETEQVTIIGSLPILETGDLAYPGISMIVKNVGIVIPDNKKKITLIDGKYASNFKVDSIIGAPNTSSYSGPYTDEKLPVIDCIGIRGLQGLNFGEGYRMDNCFMYGMGVGFDICGEHLVANNLGAYNCLWNYRFGYYDEAGRVSAHPNTLINCCGEQSVNDVLFVKSPGRQTIQMIDYNMEVMPITHGWPMNPSIEELKGQFNGRITYSSTGNNYVNSGDIPFWESGHGVNFSTINTASLLSGASIYRPVNPNLRQKYWDTTLNKEINWIGDVWLDAMGNPV